MELALASIEELLAELSTRFEACVFAGCGEVGERHTATIRLHGHSFTLLGLAEHLHVVAQCNVGQQMDETMEES